MNLVVLDGTISSLIVRVEDQRRARARFTIETTGGEDIGIEIRGGGADRVCDEWEPGDGVQVRGRIMPSGYVAADLVRRLRPRPAHPVQASLCLWKARERGLPSASFLPLPA